MMRVLMREPYVTNGVVLGAASCYMLIAYCGATLMFSIALLDPSSISVAFSNQHTNYLEATAQFPSMVLASFGYLTTVCTGLVTPKSLTAATVITLITLVGQLFVAILIASILGRFHHRK
jgi:fructose-specific phosphotransferase system IIC component